MRRKVKVAGSVEPLFVHSYNSSCGDIVGGVAFGFGTSGGWVVPLNELKAIVAEAEADRLQPIDPAAMSHYVAARVLLTEVERAELDRSCARTIRDLIAACVTRSIPDAARMLRSILTRPEAETCGFGIGGAPCFACELNTRAKER